MLQQSEEGSGSWHDHKGNAWHSQLCHPGVTEDNEEAIGEMW